MAFDLRDHLEWEPAADNPKLRRAIMDMDWTEREPAASMRSARGHHRAWLWQMAKLLAPYGITSHSNCPGTEAFGRTNVEEYDTEYVSWLERIRPAGLYRVVAVCDAGVLDMSWGEYVDRFATGRPSGWLLCSPELSWAMMVHYEEFSICFKPRWKVIQRIVRVAGFRKPDGRIVNRDRIIVLLDDPHPAHARWESGRLGHAADLEESLKIAEVLSAVSGVAIEQLELDPDQVARTARGSRDVV